MTQSDQINGPGSSEAMVSVIIPNYNHAHFVGDAIRSVLEQDYANVEIIVVDDGSTDGSRAVVAEFGDQVQYVWQENQGLSAARNTGIGAARGAYVGVLDADDLYEPNFLRALVSLLEVNPEAAGIYCGYQFVDEKNCLLPQREARLLPAEELHAALLDGNFLVPESVLVRRDCYKAVGAFDPTLTALEDWDMWLRIAQDFTLIGTDQVLVRHRILSGSMSTDPNRMHENRLAVLAKHLGPEPNGEAQGDVLRAYGRLYLVSCIEYLQVKDTTNGYRCLQRMASICPELLLELDTFYMLGCGSQPKGRMGDFDSLNLDENAAVLIDMLDRLFSEPQSYADLGGYRRPAYANAYLSMGLLSYGARRYPDSRRYLVRSMLTSPRTALNQRTLAMMTKSLPGANQLVRRRPGGNS